MPTKNVKKSEAGGEDSGENLFLEVSPKWNVLTEILEEIDEANKKTAASSRMLYLNVMVFSSRHVLLHFQKLCFWMRW